MSDWVPQGPGLHACLRSIHHAVVALEAVSSIPGIEGSRAADHTALRTLGMLQDVYAIPWKAAVHPHHLKGPLNVIYLRQRLRTLAQDFHLLNEEPLYEIFSLKM